MLGQLECGHTRLAVIGCQDLADMIIMISYNRIITTVQSQEQGK